MSQVLYRKYRPSSFEQMNGQDQVVKVLKATIEQSKPAHAYLFSGPRGTGKTSAARIFAREINGLTAQGNNDSYLDIIEIDAASNRGINEIRDLKDKIAFAPAKLRYKVYIIDEVHMLTKEAFNAILKTLEEPPAQTVFVMATTEIHKVPATILSRVVRFDFKLATDEQILSKLQYILSNEKVTIEEQGLQRLIRLARGSYRDAESLLEKVINIAGKGKKDKSINSQQIYEILGVIDQDLLNKLVATMVVERNLLEVNAIIDQISDSGVNPQQLLYDLAEIILEDVVKIHSGQNSYTGNEMKMLYKLLSEIQTLIANFQQYLDPFLSIKLSFDNLLLGSGENLVIQSSSKPVQKNPGVIKQVEKKHTKENSAEKIQPENKIIAPVEIATGQPVPQEVFMKIVEAIKLQNARLSTMVGQGRLAVDDQGRYQYFLPYKFHLEQLQKVKNRQLILKVTRELAGQEVEVLFQQDKLLVKESGESNEMKEAGSTRNDADNMDMVEEVFADMIN